MREVPGKFSWLSFLLKIYIGRNGYSCLCVCACLSDSRIIFKQRSVNHSVTTFLKYTDILSGWNRSTQLNWWKFLSLQAWKLVLLCISLYSFKPSGEVGVGVKVFPSGDKSSPSSSTGLLRPGVCFVLCCFVLTPGTRRMTLSDIL